MFENQISTTIYCVSVADQWQQNLQSSSVFIIPYCMMFLHEFNYCIFINALWSLTVALMVIKCHFQVIEWQQGHSLCFGPNVPKLNAYIYNEEIKTQGGIILKVHLHIMQEQMYTGYWRLVARGGDSKRQ